MCVISSQWLHLAKTAMSAVHETLTALSTLLPSAQNVLCQSKTVVLLVTEPCIPTAEFKVQFVQNVALVPQIGYLRIYTCRHPDGKTLFAFCSLSTHMTCHDCTATLFNFSLAVNNEKSCCLKWHATSRLRRSFTVSPCRIHWVLVCVCRSHCTSEYPIINLLSRYRTTDSHFFLFTYSQTFLFAMPL